MKGIYFNAIIYVQKSPSFLVFGGMKPSTAFGQFHKLIPIHCLLATACPILLTIMKNRVTLMELASILIILSLLKLFSTTLIHTFQISLLCYEILFRSSCSCFLFKFLLFFLLNFYVILVCYFHCICWYPESQSSFHYLSWLHWQHWRQLLIWKIMIHHLMVWHHYGHQLHNQ